MSLDPLDPMAVQTTYTTVMKHFIEHGRAPHYTQLATMISMSVEEARQHQAEAARLGVGCWLAHDTDLVESWAPFHNIPTQYRITIDGKQNWYGQ
ncbi:MAG: hypothetical protein ACI9EW_001981 [Cellvibrionaceae bacterium]|jgi:hypothetical protein